MREVGRRLDAGNALEDQGALARTAAALRGSPFLVPCGVFRFSSFDEADAWMTEMTTRTHERLSRKISPASAAR